MSLQLHFRLDLLSDYHVSAGRRAGTTVDSALLRDYDGAPLLRGTALAGLLRDGLRELLKLPDEPLAGQLAAHAARPEVEERLFGTAKRRKRWAYSSARPLPEGAEIPAAGRWGSRDVARVRVNPRTRRADPQKLFVQEEGDARLTFYFTATCEGPTLWDQADAALLVAAARLVRHLGAARRRGRGECRLTLVAAEGFDDPEWASKALDEFGRLWLDGDLPAEPEPEPAAAWYDGPALTLAGPPRRFWLMLRTLEPVLVAGRAEAGNTYETLPVITGSTVLGALANQVARQRGWGPATVAAPDFITLFLRGGVHLSPLLPMRQDGSVVYPAAVAPLSLFVCENYPAFVPNNQVAEPHPFHDGLAQELPDSCPECGGRLRPLDGFLSLEAIPRHFEPQRCEEIHIRLDESGRVVTGDLYEYIALQAGQWFVGELACANDECWQVLNGKQLRFGRLRLGKAAQRGYGLVELVMLPWEEGDRPSPMRPRWIHDRVRTTDEPLRLLLLSDAIVTDPWGRYYQGYDRVWLAEVLGIEPAHIQLLAEYSGRRRVDAFHGARRLPRWRDEAIVAGSAAAIRLDAAGLETIEAAWRAAGGQDEAGVEPALSALRWRVAQVENDGVGLRRQEGFGRLYVNHPLLAGSGAGGSGMSGVGGADSHAPGSRGLQAHPLQAEAAFALEWAMTLDEDQRDKPGWQQVNARFEPLARLLFVSRYQPLDALQQQLKKLKQPDSLPEYLWGKQVSARSDEAKLNKQGVEVIEALVKKLADEYQALEYQAIGLELLAERVALAARKGEA